MRRASSSWGSSGRSTRGWSRRRRPLVLARHGRLLRRPEVGEDVGDRLADGLRVDAVLDVVGLLQAPAAVGLGDGPLHRVGDLVGVHDHLAVDVAGGPADRLDERRLAAEEALLVGVEDGHQRHLGQVEALPQQVDADEHVELAEPQVAEDLDALDGVDLGVQVAHPHAQLEQVVGEVLGHLLGERGDQHPVARGDPRR